MGITNSNVKAVLRQLDTDQLHKLAKRHNAKKTIHELTRPKLVDFLSHIITRREINELLAKYGRTGDKAVIDGMTFERKAMSLSEGSSSKISN